jgi:hypothetical protein
LGLASITPHCAAKYPVAAIGTYVAGFFILNPLFSTKLSSIGDGPENYLLAHGHGELVDVPTRKFIALMTSVVTSFFRANSDLTHATMKESFIGQASAALNVFSREGFTAGENAFAGGSSLVEIDQPLLELDVVVAMSNVNGTDTAIESAGRNEIGIYRHSPSAS